MNGEPMDPPSGRAPAASSLLGPAISPRTGPHGPGLGASSELPVPFLQHRSTAPAEAEPPLPPLTPEPEVEVTLEPVTSEAAWGAEEPWEDGVRLMQEDVEEGEDATALPELPVLPEWYEEEAVDATAQWLIDLPPAGPMPHAESEEISSREATPAEAAQTEAEAPEEPRAVAAAPPAAAPPALGDVADRLERIARSLRSRGPSELMDPGAESDPLQLLITGYAMGYAEAARSAAEKRGRTEP